MRHLHDAGQAGLATAQSLRQMARRALFDPGVAQRQLLVAKLWKPRTNNVFLTFALIGKLLSS
jgi:hypothetical protein